MEKFQTSIFEKTKERSRRQLRYNLWIFGGIIGIWLLCLFDFPLVGFKTAIGFSVALLAVKLYDDKYMGISAYGERKANLIIAEEYLQIRDVTIPYADMNNLVIYVNEYLGMSKEIFGIHHGGNNPIEFEHKGKSVSINYVIKNKHDFDYVMKLVKWY